MRKILWLAALALLVFSPSGKMLQAEEGSESPISMEISGDPQYDQASGKVEIPVTLKNNTDKFFDNLHFGIELYKGEALREDGDLFGDLEYSGGDILPLTGEDKSLAPNEEVSFKIDYTCKSNLDSGKYFLKLVIQNDSGISYALDYTKNPLEIKGSDSGNLGFFRCFFSDEKSVYSPSVGMPIDKGINPEVILSLDGNSAVVEKLKTPGYMLFSEVYKNDVNGEVVYDQTSPIEVASSPALNVDGSNQVEVGWVMKTRMGKSLEPGTYRIKTSVVDADKNEISHPCYTRWVVRGASARIGAVNTRKSVYQKGENLDLEVDVFGPADETEMKAALAVSIFDQKGNEIDNLSKNDIELGSKTATVSFAEKTFAEKTTLGKLVIELKDQEGKVIDSQTFTYKEIKTPGMFLGIDTKKWVTFLAIVFALIFVGALVWRFKNRTAMFIFLILGMALILNAFLVSQTSATTYYKTCYPENLSAWYSSASTACVSGTSRLTVSIAAQASNCINGLTGSGQVAGTSFYMEDKGHVLSAVWGPYSGYGTSTSLNSSFTLKYPTPKTVINYPYPGDTTIYQSGCSASGSISRTPSCLFGNHDGVSGCATSGWALDQDAPSTSLDVHIYKEGNVGLGAFKADQYRADVNAAYGATGNHGFRTDPSGDLLCKSALRDGATHSLYVYGINVGAGNNTLLSNSPKSITCPGMPVVNLSASPTTVTYGSNATLTWSTANISTATGGYCSAWTMNSAGTRIWDSGWNGSVALNGSQSVKTGTGYIFYLKCGDRCFATQKGVTVNVNVPTPQILSFYADPPGILEGQGSTLHWSTANVTSCTASGAWSGNKAVGAGKSEAVYPPNLGANTYTLTCKNDLGNSVTASAVVTVSRILCQGTRPSAGKPCEPSDEEPGATGVYWRQVASSSACTDAQKCEYYIPPTPGAVGPANGQTFCAKPNEGLCNSGTPSEVTESADGKYWEWTCSGSNGGETKPGRALKSCAFQEVNPS